MTTIRYSGWETKQRALLGKYDKVRVSRHEAALDIAALCAKAERIRASVRKTDRKIERLDKGSNVFAKLHKSGWRIWQLWMAVCMVSITATILTTGIGWGTLVWTVVLAMVVNEFCLSQQRNSKWDDPNETTTLTKLDPEWETKKKYWLALAATEKDRLPTEQWTGQQQFRTEQEVLFADGRQVHATAESVNEDMSLEDRAAVLFNSQIEMHEMGERWEEFLSKWVFAESRQSDS